MAAQTHVIYEKEEKLLSAVAVFFIIIALALIVSLHIYARSPHPDANAPIGEAAMLTLRLAFVFLAIAGVLMFRGS